jgi:two-component system, chemotaxis family, protein-glutamate methylesterase/glutaminase
MAGESRMVNAEGIRRDLFCLGASAGGIEALIGIFGRLPPELPATLAVVLHRSPSFASTLAAVLGRRSSLPVVEPKHGEAVEHGKIYLAPRDLHLMLDGEAWALSDGPPVHRSRPAVDPLLISAARSRGPRVVGVLLSGGGVDGVQGLIAVKRHGGLSIAQEPAEATHSSMPEAAIEYDDVDLVLRVERIAEVISSLAAGSQVGDGDGFARAAGEAR